MVIEFPDWSRNTFLIVEDVDNNYNYLRIVLERAKAKFFRAYEGEEAIELVKTHPEIDIVLMDIQLPGIDGYEATWEIKKIRPELIILGQTAHALKTDIQELENSQLDDFITKPVRPAALISFIQKYL